MLAVGFPKSCAFLFGNRGAVLIDMTCEHSTQTTTLELLQNICNSAHATMGIGHSFVDIRGVGSAHKEAATVLRYLGEYNTQGQAVYLSDVIVPIIEQSILDDLSVTSIMPTGLLNILNYDDAHRTELYQTLKMYIETNCSPTKYANMLHIGRSTFQYRYDKIVDFLDLDFSGPDVQLILRLSFKLIERTNKRQREKR